MKKSQVTLTAVIIAVLAIGGLFLFRQSTRAPGCAGQGPCMLFFYADW